MFEIEKTINLSQVYLYSFLLALNIARIFIAYESTQIKWTLIDFLSNKGNNYQFIKTLFKIQENCFDIYGNVLIYNMFEKREFVLLQESNIFTKFYDLIDFTSML